MTFEYMLMDRRILRIIGTFALFFIYYKEYVHQGLAALIGSAIVFLFYSVMILYRETWWDSVKYTIASSVIIIVALILHYRYGILDASLLWPLICILVMGYGKNPRISVLFSSVSVGFILMMAPFSLGNFLAMVGIFLGIGSRKIRLEAYRMSQLHLEELHKAHKELQEAHAELQEATVHSVRYAALEERTRLAREIHDGLGHQLTSLIVQLQALEIMLPGDPERASEAIKQLLDIARQAMTEVRTAVREWANDEMGLGLVALKGLVSQTQGRSSIQFHFEQDSEMTEWPIVTSILLYRILQESLTNVLRHSNAKSVIVNIMEEDDQIFLKVTDDGIYTEDSPLIPGFGLKGIMERCRLSEGSCRLKPVMPHGLRIEVKLPIKSDQQVKGIALMEEKK